MLDSREFVQRPIDVLGHENITTVTPYSQREVGRVYYVGYWNTFDLVLDATDEWVTVISVIPTNEELTGWDFAPNAQVRTHLTPLDSRDRVVIKTIESSLDNITETVDYILNERRKG